MNRNRPVMRWILRVGPPLLAAGVGVVTASGPGSAWAQVGQPRITVVASPDLDSVPMVGGACPGCDGRFTTGDALRGNADPLPPLTVMLLDGDGRLLEQAVTQGDQFGSQTVSFAVAAPGDFSVEVLPPSGWLSCPDQPALSPVSASDFGSNGAARVEVGYWRGCATETALPVSMPVSNQNPVTSTEVVTSHISTVPPAAVPRLPRAGLAVASSGRLMFGLAAAAVTFGLLGLAYESGLARRS